MADSLITPTVASTVAGSNITGGKTGPRVGSDQTNRSPADALQDFAENPSKQSPSVVLEISEDALQKAKGTDPVTDAIEELNALSSANALAANTAEIASPLESLSEETGSSPLESLKQSGGAQASSPVDTLRNFIGAQSTTPGSFIDIEI